MFFFTVFLALPSWGSPPPLIVVVQLQGNLVGTVQSTLNRGGGEGGRFVQKYQSEEVSILFIVPTILQVIVASVLTFSVFPSFR